LARLAALDLRIDVSILIAHIAGYAWVVRLISVFGTARYAL